MFEIRNQTGEYLRVRRIGKEIEIEVKSTEMYENYYAESIGLTRESTKLLIRELEELCSKIGKE